MISKSILVPFSSLTFAAFAFAGPVSPINPNVDSSKDAKSPAELQNAVSFEPVSADWTLSAGYQWRDMGSLNFHTGSAASHYALPWMAGGSSRGASSTSTFGNSSGAGSASAIGNRTYSDGFVNEDGGTPMDGLTGYWGYNNASQLSGTTLSLHNSYGTTNTSSLSSDSHVQSSSLRSDLGWNSDVGGSGWFASLGSPAVFRSGALSVNFELGYSFATADSSHETPNVFQAHQSNIQTSTGSSSTTTNTLTDNYDVTGIVVPSAPYVGTLAGPGPLINNIPTSRSITSATSAGTGGTTTSVQTADFSSNVNESLRLKLNTISLGPHLSWEMGRLSLGVSAGFALNIADWDSTYREELNVRQGGGAYRLLKAFQYENNGLDALPGAYGELNANFRLSKHWALFAGGRYDWAGTLHGDAGPSSFGFKVRGASVQGGITFVF